MNKEELFGNSQQNTGYVTFEEVASAFKIPTQMQADYDPKPEPSPGSGANPTAPMGDLSHLADPNGEALNDLIPTEPEPAPVDHDHAMRTGERIARMVDTGIDFTLSNFVAKTAKATEPTNEIFRTSPNAGASWQRKRDGALVPSGHLLYYI